MPDNQQILDYQTYRTGFRKIASSTNARTLIATIIPPAFHGENFQSIVHFQEEVNRATNNKECLLLVAIWNSFVLDYSLRHRVSANINFFYIYQLPIPRLKEEDKYFQEIVENAAKLICTTEEFEQLAKEVGIGSHKNGVTEEAERMAIRAKLDAIVAHLYELTLTEFQHILTTFPLVPESVKTATLKAYQNL